MADELNTRVTMTVQAGPVATTPIDDTLSISGQAADAKAVGDALADKADRSEIQTAIQVNGQSADAQGLIIVTAEDTPLSGTDNTTIAEAIEEIDSKTGADIPIDSSTGAQTIAQALSSSVTRTADAIAMSATDTTTVKEAVDNLTTDVSEIQSDVQTLEGKTGADIPLDGTSGAQTIAQAISSIETSQVKTVNETEPDEDGNIDIRLVPYADNLYSEDAEQVDDTFLVRTTAGSGSLSDGSAWAQKIMGNSVHDGFVAEELNMTVNAIPRTTPPAITATLDEATFETYVEGAAGTYTLTYDSGWDNDPDDYGLTISNVPVNGDVITITWDGENDAVVSITAGPRTAPPAITATIDRDTFVAYVTVSGTTTLTYTTGWSADPALYGITVSNDPVAGDQIVVVYVKEVRGTITVAHPTKLVGTGWNIYDHTNGYARCVRYSETFGYAISGDYTSLTWVEELGGTAQVITPDSSGLFMVPGEGYIMVNGGNATNTAIWTTWSDWISSYDGAWEAYSESTVDISTVMSAYLPYGLCKVGDVADEIDFVHNTVTSRIVRVAYSEQARAAAEASGQDYDFDENYIYSVRTSEVVNTIDVDEEYTVSEHGLEFFTGSEIGLYTEILYGQNLKDKLRRDVLTISEQTLTSAQQNQVQNNLGLVPTQSTGITTSGYIADARVVKTLNDGKVNKTDIVNNLTTNDANKVLSAAQGYALNNNIALIGTVVSNAVPNQSLNAEGKTIYANNSITLPAGVWVICGSAVISSAVADNRQGLTITISNNSGYFNQEIYDLRYQESTIDGVNQYYNVVGVVSLTSSTTYYAMIYNGNASANVSTWLRAVRIK